MTMLAGGHAAPHAAVVWVDGWHALVAQHEGGRPTVAEIDREADPVHDYLVRVARTARDCDRLMILGPERSVHDFEQEYATLYRRSDRFVDAEPAAGASVVELLERLRFLEPDRRRG